MNKTVLIAGGVGLAALASGAAGGYFFAKDKFGKQLDGLITLEVLKTKKYYDAIVESREIQIANLQAMMASDPEVYVDEDVPTTDENDDDEPSDEEIIAQQEAISALVNYQGYAKKPDLAELASRTTSNIFDMSPAGKKTQPIRDPETGKFVPKAGPRPYLITPEDFLINEPEHEQESLFYFQNDDTAVLVADPNEVIDNAILGKENLLSFPEYEEPAVIYVRHEGLEVDYQVTRNLNSLTEHMGMGEDDLEEAS